MDVAIVGAGPAGVSAALALRAMAPRARVMLLDAATFPREKPCGGAIARRGVEALASLGVPLRVPHVPLASAELRGSAGGTAVALEGRRPLGVVVRRLELDASLVQAARARGVEVNEGVRVRRVGAFAGGARLLETSAGRLRARRIIGADGATSLVSKQVRSERGGPLPRVAAAVEAFTGAGTADPPQHRIRYDFAIPGTPRADVVGYAWDFPCRLATGEPGWNRGLYTLRPHDLSPLPARQRNLLATRGAAEAEPARTWPERIYDERRPISAPGLFLAGEAIGANPLTGEGIAPAIESAIAAARWTARSLDDGIGPGSWEPFTHAFRRSILGRRLAFGGRLARMLYGTNGAFWRRVAFHDVRFQRMLLEDFAGEIDLPHWKRWLMARLAWDVACELVAPRL